MADPGNTDILAEQMDITPIKKSDIEIGKPLRWPVYGRDKKLLLREGFVIESQSQLDRLVEQGMYRNPSWQRPPQPVHHDNEHEEKTPPQSQQEHHISFSEIGLNMGDPLQIQPLSSHENERYYVKLVGLVKNESIILTTPIVDGHVLLLRDGQDFILRMFSGKNAYACKATILRVCNTPYPYLHLSYPTQVQGVSVRNTARMKTKMIASVSKPGEGENNEKCSATITDLSLTGAKLDAPAPLGKLGEELKATFRIKTSLLDTYLAITCIIRRIDPPRSVEGSSVVEHGLQFMNMEVQDILAIQHLLYLQLIDEA